MNDQDYSLNYIGTHIRILKTIMNASHEKNFHSNLDFKKSWFKKPGEEVYNIYLIVIKLITNLFKTVAPCHLFSFSS